MNRSASLLIQSTNFESSSYTTTPKLNQLVKSEKFQKSQLIKSSKSAKLINRITTTTSTSNLTVKSGRSKKSPTDFDTNKEVVELYSLQTIEKNTNNQRNGSVKRSYQSQIKIAIDDLPFNRITTNSFIQKSTTTTDHNAKIKKTQRNKIYALNALMTSLEYENYLQFCAQHNIKAQ